MSDVPSIGAFAIVPSNNLAAAISFWERLGFVRSGGEGQYVIMIGWNCEVHLTQAGAAPWNVPEQHNPFGVFIRTPDVDAIAVRVDDLIIRPGGILRHREWGIYEVGISGPDGLLVRIGWPSHLIGEHGVNQLAAMSGCSRGACQTRTESLETAQYPPVSDLAKTKQAAY